MTMPTFSFKSASEFPILQLAELLTRGFEGYFVPINITDAGLLTMIRRDSVDLAESRVLLKDGEPIGVALIARRGWASRLAAMGIVSHARNGGAGTFAMEHLIEEARARGDRQMFLEVIEQNIAGVKLYQKVGFKTVRRLVGYQLDLARGGVPAAEDGDESSSKDELQEVDVHELAKLISTDGIKDLPWQLSSETIAHHTPSSRAFRLNDAYCLIGNPDAEHVSISSVLVKADSRRAGQGQRMMRAVFSRFPNKTWHIPEHYPKEMALFFESFGMKRTEISQWQMVLML